jgi:hypothetical protein
LHRLHAGRSRCSVLFFHSFLLGLMNPLRARNTSLMCRGGPDGGDPFCVAIAFHLLLLLQRLRRRQKAASECVMVLGRPVRQALRVCKVREGAVFWML